MKNTGNSQNAISRKQHFKPHKTVQLKGFGSSCFSGGQVLTDHQRNLKHDSVVKQAQIQPGKLLDLLQTVHQSVSVDKQLTGGFGHIQVVFKKLIDGEQGFLIQAVNGVVLIR